MCLICALRSWRKWADSSRWTTCRNAAFFGMWNKSMQPPMGLDESKQKANMSFVWRFAQVTLSKCKGHKTKQNMVFFMSAYMLSSNQYRHCWQLYCIVFQLNKPWPCGRLSQKCSLPQLPHTRSLWTLAKHFSTFLRWVWIRFKTWLQKLLLSC